MSPRDGPNPRARQKYSSLIVQEAEAICHDRSTGDPEEPHLLHLRGLLAFETGHHQLSVAYLQKLVTLVVDRAIYWADLGDVLMYWGRYADAEVVYREAIILEPANVDLLQRLGHALFEQHRLSEARICCEEALSHAPHRADLHGDLAEVLGALGQVATALTCAQRSVALDSSKAATHGRLGQLRLQQHEWDLAWESFRNALQCEPNLAACHVGLGKALRGLNRVDEAINTFRRALVLDPHHVDACSQLVLALEDRDGRHESVTAWCQLGEACHRADRLPDAAHAYAEALSRKPDCLKALWGLAGVNIQMAKPGKAVAYATTALAIEPEHRPLRQALGWAWHHLGEHERGWAEMARYDGHTQSARRYFEQPLWDGRPLDRQVILLWADEALGDTIQYVRYARLAKERGASVIVHCDRRLIPLLERAPHVDRVVARRMPLGAFDVQAPLSALPKILGTCGGDIPNRVPYLTVDPQLTAKWRTRLGSGEGALNVGLVWGGDPTRTHARERFSSLEAFAILAEMRDVRFVGLQQGYPAGDLLVPPNGLRIDTFLEETRSIANTAALILNLDLVLTVDTMIAHLAGALAMPVWALLPHSPDWRWRIEGDTSPWYPTMRLFRQQRRGDWRTLLIEVRDALVQHPALRQRAR